MQQKPTDDLSMKLQGASSLLFTSSSQKMKSKWEQDSFNNFYSFSK